MGPLFESPPRPSLKSGLLPLDRYGTCQETISRRPEQMCTPSDTGLEWLGVGPLFKSVLDKRQGVQTAGTIQVISGPSLKSSLGLLFRNAGAKMWALFESPLSHYLCQACGPWPGKSSV